MDSKILPVMAGTAGHVDHGKTSLTRNLTGFDTDNLREEKERGLSIDFGVAPCRLPGGGMVGIIDVPGHLDFIRNMVAGTSSVDILLLVVAADDGVMPQTREHLVIARLLGATRVIGVLTKVDVVDAEARRRSAAEVSSFLEAQGFPSAPVVEVSNHTGEGMDNLLRTLEKLALEAERTVDPRAFRMDIRRGFAMKGHGAVATGVPVSGSVALGQTFMLWPEGRRVRVRGAQNYRNETKLVGAGVSVALNLRDVGPDEIERGMTLAAPDAYGPTKTALVHFRNGAKDFSLRRGAELIFHCGTSALPVRCRIIGRSDVPPGSAVFLRVDLPEPRVLMAGDRFILRRPSPSMTVGGGVILSVRRDPRQKRDPLLTERLKRALRRVESGDFLGSELWAGPSAVGRGAHWRGLTGYSPSRWEEVLREKEEGGELSRLGADGWLVTQRGEEIREVVQTHLRRYHFRHPYAWGMEPGHLLGLLGLEAGSFDQLFPFLLATGEVVLRHGRLALADFQPALEARLLDLREAVVSRLSAAAPNGMARGNLLKDLGCDGADLKVILKLLREEGSLLMMGSAYLLRDAYEQCRAILLECFERSLGVDLGTFRRAAGLPRNTAVAILESFDAEGFTRREGDARVLVKRRRTAPGGVHGLQNRCGAGKVPGGFDSHTPPPIYQK